MALGAIATETCGQCSPLWTPVGGVPDNGIRAMAVYDDGSGPALYAGGSFSRVSGVAANKIARWDGAFWSPLGAIGGGGGGGGLNGSVHALTVFDDGTGPALYAAGSFTAAGTTPAARIAKWDGTAWSRLSFGLNATVLALTVFDDGSGDALYVGGDFTAASGIPANRVARWNGSAWSSLGAGINAQVKAMAVFDDGGGDSLYVGGVFSTAGAAPASRIARWDGALWFPLGADPDGVSSTVNALTVFNDGTGNALYVGGSFLSAGGNAAQRVARWDGANWAALGFGLNGVVNTIAVFNHPTGAGAALFAGGSFVSAGIVPTRHIAVWDGLSWRPAGNGVDGAVKVLASFDTGVESVLFAGNAGVGAGNDGLARWGAPVPLVTSQPRDQTVEVREPVAVSLVATSVPGPMMIQWRKDGQPLVENPPHLTGTQTATLRLDRVGLADAGVYDALLANVCGSTGSSRAALTVTCYADCDESTGAGVLDVFDFLCFQSAFVGFSPYADCDGDGLLNIFDFLCFQDAFTAGCF